MKSSDLILTIATAIMAICTAILVWIAAFNGDKMIYVYTRDGCGYCKLAKELLEDRKIEYTELKIDHNITRDEVISKFPNVKTLPIILEDEKMIGTWGDLVDWANK